ncbi:hypothetical protein [Streptomyces sp. NPDC005141]
MSRRTRMWILAVGALGFAALFTAACLRLPGFGGDSHPYGQACRARGAR